MCSERVLLEAKHIAKRKVCWKTFLRVSSKLVWCSSQDEAWAGGQGTTTAGQLQGTYSKKGLLLVTPEINMRWQSPYSGPLMQGSFNSIAGAVKQDLLHCETSLISKVVTGCSCENLLSRLYGSKDGSNRCSGGCWTSSAWYPAHGRDGGHPPVLQVRAAGLILCP